MNIQRINNLIASSGMGKSQVAERSGVSRTTLDNILAGQDAKISTVEALARVLGVRVGYLFDESSAASEEMLAELASLRRQLGDLRERKAARVTVELDLDEGELAASGLKKKIIARLKEQ